MKPTDIAHLVSLGTPTISPDGRTAVVAVARPDLDEDEYRSRLWLIDLTGEQAPRELTHGTGDRAPKYSPDGAWIAFLRAEPEGKPQVHVLPTAGGDARKLTDLAGGAGAPQWSPNSKSIAFSTRVPDEGRYGQDEKITPGKEAPRRITGLQYRLDGVGFTIDQRNQIFVVDLDGAKAEQITSGGYENTDVTWSPDGEWLAFASARHDNREHDLNADIFVMRPDGSDLRQVTDSTLWAGQPRFTPAGDTIVFQGGDPGADGGEWVAVQTGLYTVPVAGGERPTRRTDDEKINLVEESGAMVVDDDRALVLFENRGANEIISVPLHGGDPTTISAGKRMITGFDRAGDTIALVYMDELTSGELAVLRDGEVHQLTDFGAALREHAAPRPLIELTPTAPDGQELHGFLVVPEGDGPHPVLLMIHGGPFAQYGWTVFDEAQVYAGAGYAVVYTNPRGSSGYGAEYGKYIKHDVGDKSMADLMVLLDDALTRPELDENRLGVLGGSHGGYMTSWIVGHTDRFRAAVSERAVNYLNSFVGASDIGWGFCRDLYGDDPESMRRLSPLTYAGDITTPLLIIHSEQDWRCPIEQAQQLYVALRNRDAEVEMLLFPGEGHELSRSGLPSHRVARFDAILDWFGRYLKP